MTDQEDPLKKRMAELWIPPSDPYRKEMALRLALSALDTPPSSLAFRNSSRLVLKFAAACLMVAGIATFIFWPCPQTARTNTAVAVNNEPSLKTLEEISLVFPDQLDAIIAKGGQLDLQLSDVQVRENTDQVVKVTCTNEEESCIIITYSGRNVSFTFAGGNMRITPLINGEGSVIILTHDRVILPQHSSSDSIQLSAVTLASR